MGEATSCVPQIAQNLALGRFAYPHLGQVLDMDKSSLVLDLNKRGHNSLGSSL